MNIRLFSLALAIGVAMGAASVPSLADTATSIDTATGLPTTGTGTTTTTATGGTNPSFSLKDPGLGALFSRCALSGTATATGVAGAIGQLATQVAPSGRPSFGLNGATPVRDATGACTIVDPVDEALMSDCKNATAANNSSYLSKNAAAAASLTCRRDDMKAVRAQLQCFAADADNLKAMIAQIQSGLSTQVQLMKTQAQKMKETVDDREKQAVFVEGKQHEVEAAAAGAGVLLEQMDADLYSTPAAGPDGRIASVGFREQIKGLGDSQQALDEMVEQRKLALTQTCFKTTATADMKCGNRTVTLVEYTLCLDRAAHQTIAGTNKIDESSYAATIAERNVSDLTGDLERMLADMPADGGMVYGKADGQAQVMDRFDQGKVSSLTELADKYGDTFSKYNTSNFNAQEFIMRWVGKCYRDSAAKVEKEKKTKNSSVARAQDDQNRNERTTVQTGNRLMTQYGDAYKKALDTMTGKSSERPNFGNCSSAPPEQQLTCLEDMKTHFTALVRGGGNGDGIVNLQLPPVTTQYSTITYGNQCAAGQRHCVASYYACDGLEKCAAQYKTLATSLRTDKDAWVADRKKFVQQVNHGDASTVPPSRGFEGALQDLVSGKTTTGGVKLPGLADSVKLMQQRLQQISTRYGVSLEFPKVEQKKIEFPTGEDGSEEVMNAPTADDLIANLASMMPFEMSNVDSKGFKGANDAIVEKEKDLADVKSKIDGSNAKLATWKSGCDKEKVSNAANALKSELEKVSSDYYCGESTEICKGSNAVMDLAEAIGKTVTRAGEKSLLDAADAGNTTGFANMCGSLATPELNPFEDPNDLTCSKHKEWKLFDCSSGTVTKTETNTGTATGTHTEIDVGVQTACSTCQTKFSGWKKSDDQLQKKINSDKGVCRTIFNGIKTKEDSFKKAIDNAVGAGQ